MKHRPIHIITPVKDSIAHTLECIESVMTSTIDREWSYTVYNDYSTEENRAVLEQAAAKFHFELVNLEDVIDRPSPNYIIVLRMAQKRALECGAHLLIVESDVVVKPDTLSLLADAADRLGEKCGEVAALTVDSSGAVNYPYDYAARMPLSDEPQLSPRHLSFCCTLLTNGLLTAFDFAKLDESKSWHDVTVSHRSRRLGFGNYVCTSLRVLHHPHGSRPHKLLKKSNPLKYYWNKLIHRPDKI